MAELAGPKDWELKPIILAGDWTFVTKNSVDFPGPKEKPGTKGQYADVAIHAGLICRNGPPGMDLDLQVELLEQVLLEVDKNQDLVNAVLEVTAEDDRDGPGGDRHVRVTLDGQAVFQDWIGTDSSKKFGFSRNPHCYTTFADSFDLSVTKGM